MEHWLFNKNKIEDQSDLINKSIGTVFVEQPLALPGLLMMSRRLAAYTYLVLHIDLQILPEIILIKTYILWMVHYV